MTDYRTLNITVLAYMGDAVYERFVRERMIRGSIPVRADLMHKASVAYVNAFAQEQAIKGLMPSLSEAETGVVRRARNHRITSKPKNADPVTYKWATAFEALLGYLYLDGQEERLSRILEAAAEITEARGDALGKLR